MENRPFSLEGKVVLVTGAAKRIGRGIALRLAREGYACGLIARTKSQLDETAELIRQNGGKAIVTPTAPTTAFRVGEKVTDPLAMYLTDIFTISVNLAGLPGLSLPCGFDRSGMPIGLQLIGHRHDDLGVLRLARAWELRRGPQRPWPHFN